jgi:hypothetical protein
VLLGCLFAFAIPVVLVIVMLTAGPQTANAYRKTLPWSVALGLVTETVLYVGLRGFGGLALILHLPFLVSLERIGALNVVPLFLMSAVAWSTAWWCVLLTIYLARSWFGDDEAESSARKEP